MMMPALLRGKARWVAALVLAISAISAAVLLLIPVYAARIVAQRLQSADNLRQMGIAIHKYFKAHETIHAPIRSKDGTPLLSWRVALLPFLGEQALFDEFHLDEPWDSPHNKRLLAKMPAVFTLPGSRSDTGMTFYRSFSGPGALFDPADKVAPTLASVEDGFSNTLAAVEAREAVPWTRPDSEIPIDNEGPRASDALRRQIGGHFRGGANVLTLDGETHFMKETIHALNLKSLTTKSGQDFGLPNDTSDGTKAETDFELNKSLFAAIKKADRLLLYEGLPHQVDEQALFEKEKRTKASVILQGFPFYPTPLDISAAEQETLKALLADERTYRQWSGGGSCSAFHPDYLAEWRVSGASYQILICLGCEGVKVYGPDRSLRCDFATQAYQSRVSTVLGKYHKNRPMPKGD